MIRQLLSNLVLANISRNLGLYTNFITVANNVKIDHILLMCSLVLAILFAILATRLKKKQKTDHGSNHPLNNRKRRLGISYVLKYIQTHFTKGAKSMSSDQTAP